MRLLYLPNEPVIGWQAGARNALSSLCHQGELSELRIYSFLEKAPPDAISDIAQIVAEFRPDAILFGKVGSFPVTLDWLKGLKSAPGAPLIAYYDGDLYGRLLKRASQQTRLMCKVADVVFVCGLGRNTELFRSYGARKIAYLPHSADPVTFSAPWHPTSDRRYDVIVIGNRIQSRYKALGNLRFTRLPGSYEREQLVRALGRTFPGRFGVFGHGWEGFEGNQGLIPFDRQQEVIRQSWISVGYDHFPGTAYYFSDRLPIALLSGVCHIVNYNPGYEALFTNGQELLWGHSVPALVDTARFALSMGPTYLNDMGTRGRRYASEHLIAPVVYRAAVNVIRALRASLIGC